jgi:hypothetical protein
MPACLGTTFVDYRDITTNTTGWLSHDYTAQLNSGRATRAMPPSGSTASAWLTGYGPGSDCRVVLQVPVKAQVVVEVMFEDLSAGDNLKVYSSVVPSTTSLVYEVKSGGKDQKISIIPTGASGMV